MSLHMNIAYRQKDQKNPAKALISNRDRLISDFIAGKEPFFPEKNALLLDGYFQESFEKSKIGPALYTTKNPYAIIALGGYGRKEQCLFSDVDLLFLFEDRVIDRTEDLIKEVVYPLWDLGLEVGHATRSIKECIGLAKKDIAVLTSLLDARFICGMSNVYLNLMDQVRKKIISGKSNRIIHSLVENNRNRHDYFGNSTYRLEPNLKEGLGGLRDYHTLLWIGRILSNIKEPRDLEYEGFLSHDEFQRLDRALSFIFEVRSRLHHLVGRKSDRLHFEYQIKLAEALQFDTRDDQKPVERFLGTLHGEMEFIKQLYQVSLYELGYQRANSRRKKETKKTRVEDLQINRGMVTFVNPEKILKNPILLMEIFRESDRYGLPLSAEATRLVKEFSPLMDDDFFTSRRMIGLFEKILISGDPSHDTLDEMLYTGVLERLIPEFKAITNRIQFDAYHLYPVDKHSLHVVRVLQRWRKKEEHTDEPLCTELYEELPHPGLLHWAALLHDIGKGSTASDHAESGEILARKILNRFGFENKETDMVADLVKEHLFLIKIATRRDINDEETCIACARRIKDVVKLKMLYLLTVADSVSTGPNAWNDWTATLLKNLFLKVLKILEKGELASEEAVGLVEEKKSRILKGLASSGYKNDPARIIHVMSPRYLLYVPVDDIIDHLKFHDALKDNDVVWDIKKNENSGTRTVTICAKDAPGLFSKIAGTFTLNGINILNAQVFTWRDNTALDIFEVKPPPDLMFEKENWNRAESHLKSVLKGRMDLAPALKEKTTVYGTGAPKIVERPVRIKVDNESSSFFTIIEVFAYDYLGLLYDITDSLFRLGLDVWISKIATKVDQVVDVFYVRDFDGQKADTREQEEKIKTVLSEVIRKF